MNYEKNAAQAFGAVIQNKENTPPDDSFDPADEFNEESDMPIFTKDERTGELTPEVPEIVETAPEQETPNPEALQNAQNEPLRKENPVNEQSFKTENKIAEIANDKPVYSGQMQESENDQAAEGDPVTVSSEAYSSEDAENTSVMGDIFSFENTEREDREPANKQNTRAETVDHSGLPIENNPASHYQGRPAPLGPADEFGITEFIQSWDAMCGRFTDKSEGEPRCMENCPFFNENIEENCLIEQFPRTDALLTWCAAVLQKYMTEETQQKNRRIDVMARMIPGFKLDYLSEEGKVTALDHVKKKESEKPWTWLDLLKTALPDFNEDELSEEGLKALKQTTQW
jgi:hypothetical protein